jgi:hypothetical protein
MYEVKLIKENPYNPDNSVISPKYSYIEAEITEELYKKIKDLITPIKDPLGE